MKSLNLKRVVPVLMALSLLAGGGMNAFAAGGPEDVTASLNALGAENNVLFNLDDGRSCLFDGTDYIPIVCDSSLNPINPGNHNNYVRPGGGEIPVYGGDGG